MVPGPAKRGRDFATGKSVTLSQPEEQVRQDFERILVESYGYPKDELDIRVRIPRGTGYFDDEADIVIYRSAAGRDPARDILGIVETKRPQRSDGIAQIKSYMTATSADWGVWTNGEDIAHLCRRDNQILDDYLTNIPERGQSVSDVGRLSKDDLRPFGRQELKSAFWRILNTLYANTTISRREKLGNEMIKLIFCKIEDERAYRERTPAFRAEAGEEPEAVKARIDELFERVREQLTHDGVFAEHETITLDAASVRWVVGQMERGSLLATDSDVVGDAFEVFAEPKLVGEKGEFFTPRGVVKIAVRLADPQPLATICDPACGSGGFLIHAMKHIWDAMERHPRWRGSPDVDVRKREMATQTIYGIDKETDLVRIAKAYMAISGDGRSNIVHDNSLHNAAELTPAGKQHFVDGHYFRTFDFVLTNPPFGTKTKVLPVDCKHFSLGHVWSKGDSGRWEQTAKVPDTGRDPYVLFVERCLDMLRPGGTLAIVLPETVFHARSLGYLRQFLRQGNSISAIISLPHNTFRPHCNAKTCLVVLRKDQPQQEQIIMANPDEMGHDHQGKTIYKTGTEEVWDDLQEIFDEINAESDSERGFLFTVDADAINPDILVPSYYEGLMNAPALPEGRTGVTLGELVDSGFIEAWDGHGSPPATAKGNGPIPYIRVSDIVNWEMYRNPVSGIPEETYQRLLGKKRRPEAGDVVFVRRGSYRIGTVAMASPRDSEVLLTREILSLRVVGENPYGITPFYLLFLLSSQYVQEQIPCRVFIDTTLPNLDDRWRELILPIHEDQTEARSVGAEVERAIRSKWQAQDHIDALREASGGLTT